MNLLTSNLDSTQQLINVIAEFDLKMALLKDTPMFHTLASFNYTRPNNVFASSPLVNHILCYITILDDHLTRMIHCPIVIILNTSMDVQMDPPQCNFKGANWEAVREDLVTRLAELEQRNLLHSEVEFYVNLNVLMLAVITGYSRGPLGFGLWLQLMCCTYLLTLSKYFTWGQTWVKSKASHFMVHRGDEARGLALRVSFWG